MMHTPVHPSFKSHGHVVLVTTGNFTNASGVRLLSFGAVACVTIKYPKERVVSNGAALAFGIVIIISVTKSSDIFSMKSAIK